MSSDSLIAGCGCVAFPFAGSLLGVLLFFAFANFVEELFPPPNGTPVMSYGQQAVLVTLPMCMLIGLGAGVSVSFAVSQQLPASILAFTLCSFPCLYWNNRLWCEQVQRHGRDYSEIVLYYPPLLLVGVAATLPTAWLVLAIRRAGYGYKKNN